MLPGCVNKQNLKCILKIFFFSFYWCYFAVMLVKVSLYKRLDVSPHGNYVKSVVLEVKMKLYNYKS